MSPPTTRLGSNRVPVRSADLANSQSFDFEGLRGRLLSSSYAPTAGHPRHTPMLFEFKRIFQKHESGNQVRFDYDTELYFGRFTQPLRRS